MAKLSEIDYASAGVSLTAQNEVNIEIKNILKAEGLQADGLFGGAVDITHLKSKDSVNIGVHGMELLDDAMSKPYYAGESIVNSAISTLPEGVVPIALLDYVAGPKMDKAIIPEFVRGVARTGLQKGVPTIGGESAEMPGTYGPGEMDAYVHIIYEGNFGKTIDIKEEIAGMKQPLLCGTTDGTGTKTRIVRNPEDIIYHGCNDIGAIGVKPLAFALYVAGSGERSELTDIVEKSRTICEKLGLVALDPTISNIPLVYAKDQVDIAGTVIGVIDNKDRITGEDVHEGDVIIGIHADGLMTNGYSLARNYTESMRNAGQLTPATEAYIKKELSRPHVPYTDILFGTDDVTGILAKFSGAVKATAHITGGGQKDNMARMVPDGLAARVIKETLPLPEIVKFFRDNSDNKQLVMKNMYEALNMGVGFTITVAREIAPEMLQYINDNFAKKIPGVDRPAAFVGKIEKSKNGEKFYFAD